MTASGARGRLITSMLGLHIPVAAGGVVSLDAGGAGGAVRTEVSVGAAEAAVLCIASGESLRDRYQAVPDAVRETIEIV
jgi:hypothetical protein